MFSEQALNCYPRLPTCINLARIPKDLKIHNLIRGPLGSMHMSSEMTEILSPLSFPLTGQNHASQCVLATKGRADRVMEVSCEEKEGKGRQKPLGPPVFVQDPPFPHLDYLLPGATAILLSQQALRRLAVNGNH